MDQMEMMERMGHMERKKRSECITWRGMGEWIRWRSRSIRLEGGDGGKGMYGSGEREVVLWIRRKD